MGLDDEDGRTQPGLRWSVLGRVAALLGLLWFSALLCGRASHQENQQVEEQPATADDPDEQPNNPQPVAAPDRCVDRERPSKQKKRERLEDRYWRWSIINGVLTWIIAGVAAIAAGKALEASWKAVEAAHQQTDIAAKALIADSRPWIQVIDFSIAKMEVTDRRVAIWTKLVLKNVGHSPATAVHLRPELKPLAAQAAPSQEVRAVCSRAKSAPSAFPDTTIFPGEPKTIETNEVLFSLGIAEIERAKEDRISREYQSRRKLAGDKDARREVERELALPLRDGFLLLGCATYSFPAAVSPYQTSFGGELLHVRSGNPTTYGSFELSQVGVVPLDQLHLDNSLNGSFAN